MALWLARMGADVHGFALDPLPGEALFDVARVGDALSSDTRCDLGDYDRLKQAMITARPDVVIHMAAQPLVRASYQSPLKTFADNVMGTAHVLEAMRDCETVQAAVIITTDKVYHNPETPDPFSEDAPLGGEADPYSASKAAAEIVTSTWRKSFLDEAGIKVASVRAGNVIGGGDWSADRLVPDCLAAFADAQPVRLRYPHAVRPWQHVVEPVAGYLVLAQEMLSGRTDLNRGWNYGPNRDSEATVGHVAQRLAEIWGGEARVELPDDGEIHPHEAGLLRLDSSAVRQATGWAPRWSLDDALGRTVGWHRAWMSGEDMFDYTLSDIAAWEAASSGSVA